MASRRRRIDRAAAARSEKARAAALARWSKLDAAERSASVRKSWVTRRRVAQRAVRLAAVAERERQRHLLHRRELAAAGKIRSGLRNIVVLPSDADSDVRYRILGIVRAVFPEGSPQGGAPKGKSVDLPMLLDVGTSDVVEEWTPERVREVFEERYGSRSGGLKPATWVSHVGVFLIAGRGELGFVEHPRRGPRKRRKRRRRR